MPVLNVPIGGTQFVEKQLLNILRRFVPDPGIDDPNARDGSGHGATRDATETLTFTGDGQTVGFNLLPTENSSYPVVAVYDVTVNSLPMLAGWDYNVSWGEKFGVPAARRARVAFVVAPGDGQAITVKIRYGTYQVLIDNKSVALGSFINTGFSRGLMPLPKIQLQLENSNLERVGIGDNWDSSVNMGAVWHEMTWRVTVMSLYAEEVKELANKVSSSIMKASHDNNYLMPILNVDRIISMDYDIDQKAYVIIVMVSCRCRELFG